MKKFTKTQWKAMPVIVHADMSTPTIRVDSRRNMWRWNRANGHHVWAEKTVAFPYRNDLHRLMNTVCKSIHFPNGSTQ